MSRSLNKAVLIGNVGADAEVRTSKSGSRVASFSLATGRRWTDDRGVDHEKTDWHRIIAWEPLADSVGRSVRKGDRVYVEGRVEHRSWESAGGHRRFATEIVAEELIHLGEPTVDVKPVFVGGRTRAHDDELPF
jgi:single-strand DNA-binding protein